MDIFKKNGEYFLKIPNKIIEKFGENIEIIEVYPNLFVISKKNKQLNTTKDQKQVNKELNKKEIEIIKKIGKINSKDRIKNKILEKMNEDEKKILFNLIKRKILFNYKKNDNWYLGISKDYFYDVVLNKKENYVSKDQIKYGIFEEKIPDKIDQKNYYIVVGFDKKKYIIDKDIYNKYKEKILQKLENIKSLEDLEKETKLNRNLIKCILEVLREIDSEIIEVEKNKYKRI